MAKNKWIKKVFSSIISIGLVSTLIIPIPFISSCSSKQNYVQILCLNDFHGSIEETRSESGILSDPGILRVADTIDQCAQKVEAETGDRDNLIVISAGDNYQGSAFSNLTYGKSTGQLFHAMGINYSAIGNHEFDWDHAKESPIYIQDFETQAWGSVNYLACNVVEKQAEPLHQSWDPYVMLSPNDDFNIALIGYSTVDTPETTGGYVDDLEFKDPVECIIETIEQIYDNEYTKPDAIVVVGHDGDINDSDEKHATNTADEILKNDAFGSNVDMFFTAHSHQLYSNQTNEENHLGVNVPVIQGEKNGRYLSSATFYYDPSKDDGDKLLSVEAENIKVTGRDDIAEYTLENYANNKFMSNVIYTYNRWDDELDDTLKTIVGYTSSDYIDDIDKGKVMSEQGWLFAQIILDAYDSIYTLHQDEINNELEHFCLLNEGIIRNELPQGYITTSTLYNVAPFDNAIAVVKMSKDEILATFNEVDFDSGTDGKDKYNCPAYAGFGLEYNEHEGRYTDIYNLETTDPIPTTDENGQIIYYNVITTDFFANGGDGAITLGKIDESRKIFCNDIVFRDDILKEFLTSNLDNNYDWAIDYDPDNVYATTGHYGIDQMYRRK